LDEAPEQHAAGPGEGRSDAAPDQAPGETPEQITDAGPLPAPRAAAFPSVPVIAIAAWSVPGLGHFIMRRGARGLLFFVAVAGLAICGFGFRGFVFRFHSGDPFGLLGFLADVASGIFYLLARLFEPHGANVARALGDYGTRFIAAAGVANVLAILDACEIASGSRN
jgi:hypothetical protein